jgi:hypothetical protein
VPEEPDAFDEPEPAEPDADAAPTDEPAAGEPGEPDVPSTPPAALPAA